MKMKEDGSRLVLEVKIVNTKTGRKILPNADMNCKSRNLIYCIKCPNCDEIYIGQTGNALSERTRIHRQQIRDPNVRQIPLKSSSI